MPGSSTLRPECPASPILLPVPQVAHQIDACVPATRSNLHQGTRHTGYPPCRQGAPTFAGSEGPSRGLAAHLLPVGVPGFRSRRRGSVLPAHSSRDPRGPRVRALPSPYRARAVVSPGVSCRRARSHAGWGASTRTYRGLWMTLGTTRASLLMAAGRAVDNLADAWGRAAEPETALLRTTCSKATGGAVDRKKLRTWCRDPVRYSGR
jgi:hypothetical protein